MRALKTRGERVAFSVTPCAMLRVAPLSHRRRERRRRVTRGAAVRLHRCRGRLDLVSVCRRVVADEVTYGEVRRREARLECTGRGVKLCQQVFVIGAARRAHEEYTGAISPWTARTACVSHSRYYGCSKMDLHKPRRGLHARSSSKTNTYYVPFQSWVSASRSERPAANLRLHGSWGRGSVRVRTRGSAALLL